MSARYALRSTVEAFPAADGAIYFLRGGTDAEHVLEEPTAAERELLDLLHEPRTVGELQDALGAEVEGLVGELEALGLVEQADAALDLPPEALARYDRQLPYFMDVTQSAAATAEAQRRLMEATVAVVGTGALGSWT
ncbi:MAG TPA: hypothetical protein VHF89_03885, partial [Solirubrobacteraceae bacterium]|nr:hypothetical protein [Solirubrobacteraceae bacterium]